MLPATFTACMCLNSFFRFVRSIFACAISFLLSVSRRALTVQSLVAANKNIGCPRVELEVTARQSSI